MPLATRVFRLVGGQDDVCELDDDLQSSPPKTDGLLHVVQAVVISWHAIWPLLWLLVIPLESDNVIEVDFRVLGTAPLLQAADFYFYCFSFLFVRPYYALTQSTPQREQCWKPKEPVAYPVVPNAVGILAVLQVQARRKLFSAREIR